MQSTEIVLGRSYFLFITYFFRHLVVKITPPPKKNERKTLLIKGCYLSYTLERFTPSSP